jgi:hypothetical protein
LDWNLAAPGWDHSSGPDLQIVYYGQAHLGLTGYYILYDSASPVQAPGTQLSGSYSLGFASGHATSDPGAPWQANYLSQAGAIDADVKSIRLLARGSSFAVFAGGTEIPMQPLGDNAYAGDVSALAGTTTDLRVVNTSLAVHDPLVIDNVVLSPAPVPEPALAWAATGALALLLGRRRRAFHFDGNVPSLERDKEDSWFIPRPRGIAHRRMLSSAAAICSALSPRRSCVPCRREQPSHGFGLLGIRQGQTHHGRHSVSEARIAANCAGFRAEFVRGHLFFQRFRSRFESCRCY